MPCMVFPFTSNKTLNAYYSLVNGKGIGIHLIEPEFKKICSSVHTKCFSDDLKNYKLNQLKIHYNVSSQQSGGVSSVVSIISYLKLCMSKAFKQKLSNKSM